MRRVLFRADARPSIGIGDLMSLIHLSKYFDDYGWETHFMIRGYDAGLKLVQKFNLQRLNELPPNISVKSEVEAINQYSERNRIDLLFLEITERKLTEYQGLSAGVKKACISFDGSLLSDMDLVVDWDVDANRYFEPEKHLKTRFLLGPEYVVLPIDFNFKLVKKREYSSFPKKLMICMGGADEFNYTQKIVSCLSRRQNQMKTTIIVGSGYEYREKLEQSLSDVTFEYEVKQNISTMFDEYMDCDVAIGSGGLTASELVATRTPSVLIATYEHQIARCRYFDSVRSVKYIGYRKFDDQELMKAITYPIVPNGQIFFNTKAIINECNAIIQ
jgi:spore coat polysaccharide biosynthesis predicted glycosyltransferase SpsG